MIGRRDGMGLAIALGLRGLVKRHPPHLSFGVVRRPPSAGQRDIVERQTVRGVADMGNGRDLAASRHFEGCHPTPRFLGPIAVIG